MCRLSSLRYAVCGWSIAAVAWLASEPALAQAPAPMPVTDRDYAIDLYDGVALGNTTMVGMGGAGAANIIGTAGVLLNPAAMAVRSTTDSSSWDFDWHWAVLAGTLSTDFDNNGDPDEDGPSLLTTGIGGRIGNWSLGGTWTIQDTPIAGGLAASTQRIRGVLAKWFPDYDLAVGVGGQTARFAIGPDGEDPLFSIVGGGVVAGVTWVPREQDFRLAAAIDTPIDGGQVEADDCDPMNCGGYILPGHVRAPWRLVAGGAVRLFGSAWNQTVTQPFRDERALIVAADVVVTGATDNGHGLDGFGRKLLQPSGRSTVLGLRGGLDYELGPSRFRVRLGGYWEPGRFDGVPGRRHVTFGGDLRVFEFRFFGPRRGRISFTSDVARDYANVGFSVGFWH